MRCVAGGGRLEVTCANSVAVELVAGLHQE